MPRTQRRAVVLHVVAAGLVAYLFGEAWSAACYAFTGAALLQPWATAGLLAFQVRSPTGPFTINVLTVLSVIHGLPPVLAGILTFHWLRRGRPARPGTLPRCRRCGYILHGLSAPKCPECGTSI
jgi:hypothetical protein